MEVTTTDYFKWKPLYVIPVGDIQLGAGGVDIDSLRRDIKRGVDLTKAGEQVAFIGLGDYVDVASPSGRQKVRNADFYDSVIEALDDDAQRRIEELGRYFRYTNGQWLGLLEGHHYWDFGDGTTTDTRLAGSLGAPFLGTMAFVRVRFKRPGTTASVSHTTFAWHGHGSGQTQAAPISKLEKISGGIEADLYLINHYARRGAVPRDKLYLSNDGHIRSKTIQMVATGGYMKSSEQGSSKQGRPQGSYVEKAGMTPTAIGGTIIKITPVRTTIKGVETLSTKTEVTV